MPKLQGTERDKCLPASSKKPESEDDSLAERDMKVHRSSFGFHFGQRLTDGNVRPSDRRLTQVCQLPPGGQYASFGSQPLQRCRPAWEKARAGSPKGNRCWRRLPRLPRLTRPVPTPVTFAGAAHPTTIVRGGHRTDMPGPSRWAGSWVARHGRAASPPRPRR